MATMVLSFVVLGLVIIGMAVGVIMGRKPIAGSCGGLANVGIEGKCSICGDDPQKCDDEQEKQKKKAEIADMAYEVK
ncbi:(Na+)-NQR maturation NqrM [Amphritea japonica]|uniref:ApbE family protein n=1 Tax=Amphritea japonica ATCC BAA-1530 TaxID=1278309 RepID=A0A7R6SSB5_9GAMM|nr:(Na+)-NQR maturation NqrM [Amphritea japonica]BBB26086.1 conserved hypothetical protein [Amphritea japonica ATCC BAA-1530]